MAGQELLQDRGRQLAAATAAMGELAEAERLHDVHDRNPREAAAFSGT